ncbi:hypothetical protein [Amycolatopsis dendrobii]|uniref:Uncharacterized protein n=1 Tax=Amycolatopsis dendrobii TaxID=2760662 RepID=A0A7W3VXF8_9PSEU|nr:hypothetical protein [Amycolatopsis dendrobii]MBB1154472.1 hypothetical protein [Amycolatopsis dendrobii]
MRDEIGVVEYPDGGRYAELADVAVPRPPEPPAVPVEVDASRHLGVYERAGSRIELSQSPGGLRLKTTVTGGLAELVAEKRRTTTWCRCRTRCS